jgi:peptide-methionine (S)-S-oxide reductase
METATLAGGCFWCLEAVFEQMAGVQKVVSGYTGGNVANPTYSQVCSGATGHAEAVQVSFDPTVVSYRDLLNVFFTIHDPTTLNRQGGDVGTQYRSAIFFNDPAQRKDAQQVIEEMTRDKVWRDPIVTQLVPSQVFYPAEAYHQGYYRANEYQPYCQLVIAPKVAKLRKQFMAKLKKVTS